MVVLKFEVDGHVQLSRNLRVFAKDLKGVGMRQFYREAIDIIEARSDNLFRAQGSNVQKAANWAPLSPKTEAARKGRWGYYAKQPSRPGILRWTGRLQQQRKRVVTGTFGSLEFTAPYAKYHHRGGGNLPKRVIIDLSNPTNEEIVKALQKHIHKHGGGLFGRQA